MARPKKLYKREGPRTNPNLKVHEQTWRDFQAWCISHKLVPSDLIEEYMALTVATDSPLLADAARTEA